ncbi:hypothetical protein BU15DRAFT_80734 [Melanogaster broomeanus]|nr:hypothetical protein BU15DRAFT_80734 [Melanogaster broomeanus]
MEGGPTSQERRFWKSPVRTPIAAGRLTERVVVAKSLRKRRKGKKHPNAHKPPQPQRHTGPSTHAQPSGAPSKPAPSTPQTGLPIPSKAVPKDVRPASHSPTQTRTTAGTTWTAVASVSTISVAAHVRIHQNQNEQEVEELRYNGHKPREPLERQTHSGLSVAEAGPSSSIAEPSSPPSNPGEVHGVDTPRHHNSQWDHTKAASQASPDTDEATSEPLGDSRVHGANLPGGTLRRQEQIEEIRRGLEDEATARRKAGAKVDRLEQELRELRDIISLTSRGPLERQMHAGTSHALLHAPPHDHSSTMPFLLKHPRKTQTFFSAPLPPPPLVLGYQEDPTEEYIEEVDQTPRGDLGDSSLAPHHKNHRVTGEDSGNDVKTASCASAMYQSPPKLPTSATPSEPTTPNQTSMCRAHVIIYLPRSSASTPLQGTVNENALVAAHFFAHTFHIHKSTTLDKQGRCNTRSLSRKLHFW